MTATRGVSLVYPFGLKVAPCIGLFGGGINAKRDQYIWFTVPFAGVEAAARRSPSTDTLLKRLLSRHTQIGFFPSLRSSGTGKRCLTAFCSDRQFHIRL